MHYNNVTGTKTDKCLVGVPYVSTSRK